MPRWSAGGTPTLEQVVRIVPEAGLAPWVGLAGSSAIVRVGPPFWARGPRKKPTVELFSLWLALLRLQVASEARL